MKFNEYKRKLSKEYNDTFKIKKDFKFYLKPKYILRACLVILALFLVIEHISVGVYNNNIDKKINEQLNNTEYIKVENNNHLRKLKNRYNFSKKTSILTDIFSFQLIGCGANGGASGGIWEEPIFPEWNGSSFDTNVQVKGIDEADVSKCDGKYIYALIKNKLCVYDLSGELVTSVNSMAFEMYIYEDKIITIGKGDCYIYQFISNSLIEKGNFNYDRYIESRLRDGHLYLVYSEYSKEENIEYGNCYYDGTCYPQYIYSIVDYDLNKNEYNNVQALSGYNLVIYMSYDNFYLATSQTFENVVLTSVLMFDKDLNPVGVMKTPGTVLNQFSMDEYNGNFRIVTTDSTQDAERLNAISIFDLENLERVGFFNEGIGIGRQIVKSVTYDKDRCYVVTYENTDPLYEIDCSNPENIYIVSKLEAPGYSNYLYQFTINDKDYILGLGFTDSRSNTKISIYLNNEEGTPQVGSDFVIGDSNYYDQIDYLTTYHNPNMFTNHKALFLFNDGNYLYLGALVDYKEYVIFKIDVNDENNLVIPYKKITNIDEFDIRSYLVNGNLYFVTSNGIVIEKW